MDDIRTLGRLIILAGIVLVLIGGLFYCAGRIPGMGRLPGDIHVKRENFSFYFPLTTCLLISVILTLILLLFRR